MAASGGIILNTLKSINRFGICSGIFPGALSQVRHYAARKGTREKARKKKVKNVVKKLTIADKIRRSKKITIIKPDALVYNDDAKSVAIDDVFIGRYFKWKVYPFAEAVECHRELLHPTMYDQPESIIRLMVELNMQGVKKTKPLESFRKIIDMRHSFAHGEERNILVFCKTEEQVKESLDGGAALAGGTDVVKLILSGEVSLNNYDTVLAHPAMMPEVLTLRGLLKKKHPNLRTGTLGPDLKKMIRTHLYGIKYTAKPHEHFPEYGSTNIPIGKLNMKNEELEENLQDAINSIMEAKPKRPGSFITRLRVECPPSAERFKIDHKLYIEDEVEPETEQKDAESDDEDNSAVAVSL